jgi:hypothetical protein
MSLGFDSLENYDLCLLGSWHNTTFQLLGNLISFAKNTYSICIENANDLPNPMQFGTFCSPILVFFNPTNTFNRCHDRVLII